MTFAVRLVGYQPAGARLGILPDPLAASVTFHHNAIGSLQLTYSSLGRGGPWLAVALESGIEIAVEVNWTDVETGWVEPYGGRFVGIKRLNDPTKPEQTVTLQCPSYGWLLKKARNFQMTGLVTKGDHAGQRKFTSRSAGYIMWTLLQEHFDRTGSGISLNRGWGSSSVTSAGGAWSKSKTLYYPVGVDFLAVLDGLQASDMCDWRTDGRLLRMWNADSQWTDRAATVRLDYGRELADAPSEESLEDLFARIMVRGDKKKRKTYTSGTAPTPWGIWEGYAEAGGVDDTDDLDDIGAKELADAARLRGEYTRTLTMAGDSLPLKDYQPGDWVTGPAVVNYQRMRVQSITLDITDGGVWSGNVVLNDRVLAAELRRAKTLQSINLTNNPPAGSGTAPLPDVAGVDYRIPAAPTGLSFTNTLYLDGFGVQHAKLDGTWSAVTTATDGTDLDIAAYELWGQPTGEDWRRITASVIPAVSWKPFLPGSVWLFKVRAIGTSTTEPGVDSATSSVTFAVDTTPPPVPSTPSVQSILGALTATWDGKGSAAQPMPGDFAEVRVHASVTSGFTPAAANLKGAITSASGGAIRIEGFPYGTTVYVRLVSVDKTGNVSAASTQASGVPTQLVQTDLGVVLPGNTGFSDVQNMIRDGSNESDTIWAQRILKSKNGNWSRLTVAGAPHGKSVFALTGDGSPAQKFLYLHANGDNDQLGEIEVLPGAKLYLTYQSAVANSANGTSRMVIRWRAADDTFTYTLTAINPANPVWQFTQEVVQAPAGTTSMAIYLGVWDFTAAAPARWMFDSVAIRQVIPTALIEDLAVTDAKILSASVAKLTAGTLQAGAWIKAGDVNGYHSMLDGSGLSVFRLNPEGGAALKAGHFGTGEADFLYFTDMTGDVQAAIDETGRATFAGVSIPEKLDGYELNIYGTEFTEWLNLGPRGVRVRSSLTSDTPPVTVETVVMEVRGTLNPDRLYWIKIEPHYLDNTAATTIELKLRVAYDGAAVSTSSTVIADARKVMSSTAADTTFGFAAVISTAGQVQAEREIRVAYTIRPVAATSVWVQADATSPCLLYIEDRGPAIAETAAIAKYTSVWTANNTEAYAGTGIARTDSTYLGYSNAPMTVGNCESTLNYSLAIFTGNATSGETTKTLPTALSGATIEKVEVYLYNQWSSQSNLQVDIRTNTLTSIVNTAPSGTAKRATIPQGAGRWVDITSLWTGSSRGIWLGPTVTGTAYHGHIRSHIAASAKPQLRITYRR